MANFANLMKGGLSSADLAALLRAREAQPLTGLQDIFGYIDNPGSPGFAITPNGASGDNPGWGSSGIGLGYADTQANNGADGNQAQAPVTFKPPEQYAAGVTLSPNSPSGEGSGGYHFNVDPSKFPQTRFGDVTNAAPVGGHTSLIDPRFQYDDPNYGRITFGDNVKPDKFNSMAWPALMAAATWGMGSLGAPALGNQLINLARAFANGGNGISQLINILGGQLDLPSWVTTAANMGANALSGRGGHG